ncbi:MAG: pyridoxal-phosphate dependent enzyme [Minicystis sp.]
MPQRSTTLTLRDLDAIPRIGWIDAPTPVTPLPELASALGLSFLGVKRDDLGEALHGGSKPRKLDYLLASPPFADAESWTAAAAIGSGNLVALTAAARELGRRFLAHVFWTEITPGVLDNLAFIAGGSSALTFYRSRLTLALRSPRLFLGPTSAGVPVIPVGSTDGLAMLGAVRAGLELAEQVRRGEIPEPDRVYVSFGSGGTAVGLWIGLALAGLQTTVASVSAVEWALSTRGRARGLERALRAELARWKIEGPTPPSPLLLDHSQVGRGYAVPTKASLAAVEKLAAEGLRLEPSYTGKTMAALFADAKSGTLGKVIFWHTSRRDPLPLEPDWRAHLPPSLARRLAAQASGAKPSPRRKVILGVTATLLAVCAGIRLSGYPTLPGWTGAVLSSWEAQVVRAAGEALLAPDVKPAELDALAPRIDRYLAGMPVSVQRDIHGMMVLIEHGTTPLGGRLHRFTLLSPAERETYLSGLAARGGVLAQAYRGLRDLCMLAWYQQPSTWEALGYEGPKVSLDYDPSGPARMAFPAYDTLVAAKGTLPRGLSA